MRPASSSGKAETSLNVSTWRSGRTSRWVSATGLMSRIATKPSAAWTWSPSATSRQKRHSSRGDGKDALLRQADSTGADELAYRRVDEPGRVVVAVAAARPVDQHVVGRPELRLPAPSAELVGKRAQPRATLFLHLGPHGVRGRGHGARPRRVREDVHLRDPGCTDDVERALECSLVLAREPDDDVRGEVELGQRSDAREELPRVVAAVHGAEDPVVARLERDVDVARDRLGLPKRVHELRCDVVHLDRGQSKPVDARDGARLAHEPRQRIAGVAVAEAAEVHARQHDLAVALRRAATDLREQVLRPPAPRAAADDRDDAERARERAAVLDLHEGARPLEPRLALDARHSADVP